MTKHTIRRGKIDELDALGAKCVFILADGGKIKIRSEGGPEFVFSMPSTYRLKRKNTTTGKENFVQLIMLNSHLEYAVEVELCLD